MGPAVCRALTASVVAFLERHVRDRDIDVGEALEGDAALRVGPPAELFEVARAAPARAQPPASTTS